MTDSVENTHLPAVNDIFIASERESRPYTDYEHQLDIVLGEYPELRSHIHTPETSFSPSEDPNSIESVQRRNLTLQRGDNFVLFSPAVSVSLRERRSEGSLSSNSIFEETLRQLTTLATSGVSAQEAVMEMLRAHDFAERLSGHPENCYGYDNIDDARVGLPWVGQMLDSLVVHRVRLSSCVSEASYVNKHEEHSQPNSQEGGIDSEVQYPIHSTAHTYNHLERAHYSLQLYQVLRYQQQYNPREGVNYDELIDIAAYPLIINLAAVEVLRNGIVQQSSMSDRAIRAERQSILESITNIDDFQRLGLVVGDINSGADISQAHWDRIVQISQRMSVEGTGSFDNVSLQIEEQKGIKRKEQPIFESNVQTYDDDDIEALQALEKVTIRRESQSAANQIESAMEVSSMCTDLTLRSLVTRLRNNESQTLTLAFLNQENGEYESLLKLQENLRQQNGHRDDYLLQNIFLSQEMFGTRFDWNLALNTIGVEFMFPAYSGSELRRLTDVLRNPYYYRLCPHPAHIVRELSEEEVMENIRSEDIWPGVAVRDYLEARTVIEMADAYWRSHGVENGELRQRLENPRPHDIEPSSTLQNLDRIAEMAKTAVLEGRRIVLYSDCDQDGLTSVMELYATFVRLGVSEDQIEVVNQTRTQGHSIRDVDLLNSRLRGGEYIFICDTGSSIEDVKSLTLMREGVANHIAIEELIELQQLHKSGELQTTAAFEQLLRFREMAEEIDGFKYWETKEFRGQANKNIKLFANKLFQKYFTQNQLLTSETLFNDLTDFLQSPLYKNKDSEILMRDVPGLSEFLLGTRFVDSSLGISGSFQSVNIGIMDHHHASDIGVAAFIDFEGRGENSCWGLKGFNDYIKKPGVAVMANPEWVSIGKETEFIEKMQKALESNDYEEVRDLQQSYRCYSDHIVGGVIAGKMVERLFELMSNNDVLLSGLTDENGCDFSTLTLEERKEIFEKLAVAISESVTPEGEVEILFKNNPFVKIKVEEEWLSRNGREQVLVKIQTAYNSLISRLEFEIENVINKKLCDRASAVNHIFKNNDIDQILKSWGKTYDATLLFNISDLKNILISGNLDNVLSSEVSRSLEELENKYWDVLANGILSDGEKRFYLSYTQELLSYAQHTAQNSTTSSIPLFSLPALEKIKVYNEMNRQIVHSLNEQSEWWYTTDIGQERDIKILARNGKELIAGEFISYFEQSFIDEQNVRRAFTKAMLAWYEDNGGCPLGANGQEIDLKSKASREAKKLYDAAIRAVNFDNYQNLFRESFERFGAWDSSYLHIMQATAQIGDVGPIGEREGRSITDRGMQSAYDWVMSECDRRLTQRQRDLLRKGRPPALDILESSLRGGRLTSPNLFLTRTWSHRFTATLNAVLRVMTIKGESAEARNLLDNIVRLYSVPDDSISIKTRKLEKRKLRKRLPLYHDRAIESRTMVLKEILEDLANRSVLIIEIKSSLIEPTEGVRGLIAGIISQLYDKPTIVVHKIKNGSGSKPAQVSASLRLPGDGNIDLASLLKILQYNSPKKSGFRVVSSGGHKNAAGGLLEIKDGDIIGNLYSVFNPFFEIFEQEYPNRGVIDLDNSIDATIVRAQEDGLEDAQGYQQFMDPFEIMNQLADYLYKKVHPVGPDISTPLVLIRNARVLQVYPGKTKEDSDYTYILIEKNGYKREVRVFAGEADVSMLKPGMIIDIESEPRMGKRPVGPREMRRRVHIESRHSGFDNKHSYVEDIHRRTFDSGKVESTIDVFRVVNYGFSNV